MILLNHLVHMKVINHCTKLCSVVLNLITYTDQSTERTKSPASNLLGLDVYLIWAHLRPVICGPATELKSIQIRSSQAALLLIEISVYKP